MTLFLILLSVKTSQNFLTPLLACGMSFFNFKRKQNLVFKEHFKSQTWWVHTCSFSTLKMKKDLGLGHETVSICSPPKEH